MDGDSFGFSQAAFSNNPPIIPSYGTRHAQRENIPSINTSRLNTTNLSDLNTPGTAMDMNFTPLLPSNLLIGSPLQGQSPGFASPQFQSFPSFLQQVPQQAQQNQILAQPQQMMSPDMFAAAAMASQNNVYMTGGHSPTQQYGFGGQNMGMVGQIQPQMMMQQDQMVMSQGQQNNQSRTVYLGNIPSDTPADEILGHVRSGQIESVRLLPEKNCAFISFLDSASATHFHSDAILKKLCIKSQDIKIGWGKPSPVQTSVAVAVQQNNASRNVYLGGLPEDIEESELREELSKYGPIDTIKIVRDKSIAFVHFLSISNAMKAVSQLPQEAKWQAPRKVFYGKDRCAYVSKTQQQNAAQYLGIAPGYAHALNNVDRDLVANALAQQSVAAAAVASTAGGASNVGNRTVYLGNIHPETTIEEICNVVRGGLLHHIRYIPDKHICFVTFIDPTAAASFFALSNLQGLMIHNRRLKIGWGKHSGPLPPAISMAVAGGASRNVYVGNLDESWTEERLRQDFQEYGDIELVNTLREKSCAFVNFTNIANAIKAIEAVRSKDDYKKFKVNFGKDRCGNAPRQNVQGQQGQSQQMQQMPIEGVSSIQVNGQPLRSDSPAMGMSTNVNVTPPHAGSTASTVMNAGAGNNPLTLYLAAAQQQQIMQPDQLIFTSEITPPQYTMGSTFQAGPQMSIEHAYYGNQNAFGAAQNQYGHQATNSMNVNQTNGVGQQRQQQNPVNRNYLGVAKSHARALSLPHFPATAAQNGQTNGGEYAQAQPFVGLGAGHMNGNVTNGDNFAHAAATMGVSGQDNLVAQINEMNIS